MLVKYTLDVKDEDVTEKSIEFRRRLAERHVKKVNSMGGLSDRQKRDLADINRAERDEHGSDRLTMTMADVGAKVTMRRGEKQFELESHMRQLKTDVNRASRLTKSRIDLLTDLETRIKRMQGEMRTPGNQTVDMEIVNGTKSTSALKHERLFVECEKCHRRIVKALYDQHLEACIKLNGASLLEKEPVMDLDANVATRLTTFAPRPPRNCKFVKAGSSFLEFAWEPPVMDGGLNVRDYEVQLTIRRAKYDEARSKWKRWEEELPIRTTSLFAAVPAVCNYGCKVIDLEGGSEYCNIMVRAVNLQGASEWVSATGQDPRVPTWTEPPDAPSMPCFLKVDKITSSCLHCSWTRSQWNGGSAIVDYIIHYTVVERHVSSTSSNVMVPVDHKVNVGGPDVNSFIIRNIESDSDVVNIKIKALNAAGLFSDGRPLTLKPEQAEGGIRTLRQSRHRRLVFELKRARDSKDDFIDTDFFTGVVQRLERIGFIKDLVEELHTSVPDPEEEDEAHEWAEVKRLRAIKEEEDRKAAEAEAERKRLLAMEHSSDEDTDEDEKGKIRTDPDANFPAKYRRHHFKKRIAYLEQRIKDLKKERYLIEADRNKMTEEMKSSQKRGMMLQLELDRTKDYKGDWITSDVIHGSSMRYLLTDFIHRVSKLWEATLAAIANNRIKVIEGEDRKVSIKKEIVRCQERLKDRQAAYLSFQHEQDHAKKVARALSNAGPSDEKLYEWAWNQFVSYVQEVKATKARILRLFTNTLQGLVRSAFHKWSTGEHEAASQGYKGNGTMLLEKCRTSRLDIQSDLRSFIAQTTQLKHRFKVVGMAPDQRKRLETSENYKQMEEGMDHVALERKGMIFLYEADGMVLNNKFDMARVLYENQIWALRSVKPPNVKLLSIVHGRQGKMFLRMEKYNRAIVEFDRQLSLANEIGDKAEAAEAYFGIGTGYLGLTQYDEAIRYLDIAQARMLQIGNTAKYVGALRGLEDCYRRMNKVDVADLYLERVQREEDEIRTKLAKLRHSLQICTERLVHSTATIEHEVSIERTSHRALSLKKLVEQLHEDLEDAEAALEDFGDEFQAHQGLIDAIDKQFEEAQNTDETEMWSDLVHDQPQVVEVEELKSRLLARRKRELVVHDEMGKGFLEKQTNVRNMEDQIHAENENIELEEGNLAKHVRHDKPFRVVAFAPGNAAGNEVTGTASGGVENFMCAEGFNVHMVDYHSGELLHIFPGDDKNRVGDKTGHCGVVTCLYYEGASRRCFSGAVDEAVIQWDTENKKMVKTYKGHEGAITAIAADGNILVTAAADVTVRLWDKKHAIQRRVIHGHARSVHSIHMGPGWMVTGSQDEEVRVWEVVQKTKHTLVAETLSRLQGHDCAVTCVKYGKLELVTGDVLGRIFVWWLRTNKILRRCKVHNGAVKCMQFDALRIVSGGVDKCVCITDIATGEVLNTLRGHSGHILQLAFDTERIITVGGDNKLLYWKLGKKQGPQDKFHMLNKGETLIALAKLYHCKVDELMKWNGIREVRQCYPGMKLLVHKGDPDVPTEAEAFAMEQERRRLELADFTAKKFKKDPAFQSTMPHYDRVKRLATDIDPHSMSNRMFGRARRENELFPDTQDPNQDHHSLAARMHQRDHEAEHGSSALKPRYFIMEDNIDEWGDVADQLGRAMLELFVEYDCYDIVLEERSKLREKASVIGRIHTFEEGGYKTIKPTEKQWSKFSKKSQQHWERYRHVSNAEDMEEEDADAKLPMLLPPGAASIEEAEGVNGEQRAAALLPPIMPGAGAGGGVALSAELGVGAIPEDEEEEDN